MKHVELNPEGNFDSWQECRINELKKNKISTSLGQELLFENDSYILWSTYLLPGERLPFRFQNSNYSWTCLNGGMGISRFSDGKITMLQFEEGDTGYFKFQNKKIICDFENIGENVLGLQMVEYKVNDLKNILLDLDLAP